MSATPFNSTFQPLSNNIFQSDRSRHNDHISASISVLDMMDENELWPSDVITQHHVKARILKNLGVNQLAALEDVGLEDGTHPICKLRQEHEPGSGFRLVTNRLDKFYSRFRLSCTEFMQMYTDLKEAIERPMNGSSTDAVGRLSRRALTTAEMLLVWLWRADNINVDCVALIFGDFDRTTIDRGFDHVTRAINDAFEHDLSWPDADERKFGYGMLSCYDKIVGILDGTHCSIEVPLYEEYEHYSGYKGTHTLNYLIMVDPFGFIIWLDGPFAGRGNDRAAFNETPFALAECPMLSPGEVILVDGGFRGPGHILHQFLADDFIAVDAATDKTTKAKEALKASMRNWNTEFDLNRARIEATISKLKHRAQSLSTRFPRSRDHQAPLFFAAARMLNRTRTIRLQAALSKLTVSKDGVYQNTDSLYSNDGVDQNTDNIHS